MSSIKINGVLENGNECGSGRFQREREQGKGKQPVFLGKPREIGAKSDQP